MYTITKNSDELYHYGVLGMRWGVRRYQNYDGTRIGTGGQPVVNRAKTAEGTVKKLKSTMDKGFSNTVSGGQGGKATGNARFAATAGGSNSSNKSEDKKSTAELILEPSVKKGKDKANTSVAQETAKGLIRTGKATQDSIKVIKNSDPKVKKAQEDNATKARKMSDQELRESINRIKMEREYVSLKNDEITTGYDKAIEIIDKAKPFLEVTAEVAGLIASILVIKSKLGHSDSDMELDNLYTYCIENDFPPDVIEHATSLDLDYILDYYNVSAEDLQHMLTDEDELYHYGVLGMKWGVRRYQNYDGTRIGTGSGSGGGGGGSKSPSSSRGSIATGQGGKAVGNARLAATANSTKASKYKSSETQKAVDAWKKHEDIFWNDVDPLRDNYFKLNEKYGSNDPRTKAAQDKMIKAADKSEEYAKIATEKFKDIPYEDIDDDVLKIAQHSDTWKMDVKVSDLNNYKGPIVERWSSEKQDFESYKFESKNPNVEILGDAPGGEIAVRKRPKHVDSAADRKAAAARERALAKSEIQDLEDAYRITGDKSFKRAAKERRRRLNAK